MSPETQSTASQAIEFILVFITLAALGIGLLSMLSRKVEVWWTAFRLWYDDTQAEIMSRRAMREREREVVVAPVAHWTTTPKNTDNSDCQADNAKLSVVPIVATELPEEVRDIIRFQAQVEGLALLLKAGTVSNKAAAIEKMFTCSRSSKPDSKYQKVLRLLDPMLDDGPNFPQPLTPDQETVRQGLGLQN